MSKKIRDIVHNYIYISPIEELVTEDPLFLRLHYVHQNSFAYLTYPSAHNTRFSHSLGVMHVAGSIFQAAFQRSSSSVIDQLIACAGREFDRIFPESGSSSIEHLTLDGVIAELKQEPEFLRNAVYSPFLDSRPIALLSAGEQKRTALTLICLQGVRLAAMLHDVGHPPFSHIVEYALLEGLQQKAKGVPTPELDYRGHEHASHKIADLILARDKLLKHRYAQKAPSFVLACAAFAKSLFEAEGALAGLTAGILSGDLDADRLDYVLRDARSAGMSIDYDIERLLDAVFFEVSDDAQIRVAYRLSALPVIERFFDARYELYRWMIYHHDTTRRNLVVQRLIITLLNSEDLSADIAAFGSAFGAQASGAPTRPQYAPYENYKRFLDSSFIELLWNVFEAIDVKQNPTNTERELKRLLDIVLSRSNHLLPSVCKSPAEYADLARHASSKSYPGGASRGRHDTSKDHELIADLNERLQRKFNYWVARVKDERDDEKISRQDVRGVAKFRMAIEIESLLQKEVDDAHGTAKYRCRVYYIGSFQAGLKGDLNVCDSSGEGRKFRVDALSPTIQMLTNAWARSPQLMLYVGVSDKTAAEFADKTAAIRATELQAVRATMGKGLHGYLTPTS